MQRTAANDRDDRADIIDSLYDAAGDVDPVEHGLDQRGGCDGQQQLDLHRPQRTQSRCSALCPFRPARCRVQPARHQQQLSASSAAWLVAARPAHSPGRHHAAGSPSHNRVASGDHGGAGYRALPDDRPRQGSGRVRRVLRRALGEGRRFQPRPSGTISHEIVPHLRRAAQLFGRLDAYGALARQGQGILDYLETGIVLVDDNGEARCANRAAENAVARQRT